MFYEVILETFEDATLRVQKALTVLKEVIHRRDKYAKDIVHELRSERRDEAKVKECLLEMYDTEKEIERILWELVVFLDIQKEEVCEDVASFKEMVSKLAIKRKLKNMSYFIKMNSKIKGVGANEFKQEK